MSLPGYSNRLAPRQIAERLQAATASAQHQFWPDEISLLKPGVVDWDRVIGTNQITDAYLLALAVERRGRLVTFDSHIPVNLVAGAGRQSVATI